MRLILIQLAIMTMLSSTSSLAGPASKAFSLKWQFGSGAESSDNRVMIDAFQIRRTLEEIQRPESSDVRVDPRDLERNEELELKGLQAMDPNMEFTGETVNIEAAVRNRRQVSKEELLGGSTIRPGGATYGPSKTFPISVRAPVDSDR